MKILNRYLARHFLYSWLVVNLILAGLFSLLELVKQLDQVGEGRYHLADALLYVTLTLPGRMLDLTPPSALLGSIIALGVMAKHLELMALRMNGISIQRVGWAVVRPAVVALLTLLLGTQFIIPKLEQTAWTHRETALSETGTLLPRRGFWIREKNRIVNLHSSLGENFQAVDIYNFDDAGQLTGYVHARETRMDRGGDWILSEVMQKTISERGIKTTFAPRQVMANFLTPKQATLLSLPPEALSLTDLVQFIATLQKKGQNAERFRLALWRKLSLPVSTAGMIMLSLPFVFGPARSASFGWRILVGAVAGVGFFFVGQIAGYSGLIMQISPIWTTLAPASALLLGGIAITRKIV
ncbi:MAG: LPS export ABC transporter permease LptG [Desulfuromonadaceae bacterium]